MSGVHSLHEEVSPRCDEKPGLFRLPQRAERSSQATANALMDLTAAQKEQVAQIGRDGVELRSLISVILQESLAQSGRQDLSAAAGGEGVGYGVVAVEHPDGRAVGAQPP